jgi:hypothetical protein
VTAHGRARLEVTEMKAPVTFTPVPILIFKKYHVLIENV